MKKNAIHLNSIMLIDSSAADLAKEKKLLREMNITSDLTCFHSLKESFESLLLLKSFQLLKSKKYPDLIIMDASSEYYRRRSFLNELILLFPEKKSRPDVLMLWKTKLPQKHVLVRGWLEKPLDKDKLLAALGHFVNAG